MSVQLGWLRTFVTVYRLGSFTRAAQRLDVSQPAVTHQIRGLERELGRPLFERLPHGSRPTPAADGLFLEVQGSIDLLDSVVDRTFVSDSAERLLYVGGPAELMCARVIPAVSDLVAEGARFNFVFGMANHLVDRLEQGELDLVISTIRPRRRGILASPLVDEEFVLLAAPELAARFPPGDLLEKGPDLLRVVPLIAYAESLPIVKRYWRTTFEATPNTAAAMVVPDLRGVLAAVKSSAGISVLPRYLCTEELAAGDLVPLLTPEVPPINTFYLAVRQNTHTQEPLALLYSQLLMKARLWV